MSQDWGRGGHQRSYNNKRGRGRGRGAAGGSWRDHREGHGQTYGEQDRYRDTHMSGGSRYGSHQNDMYRDHHGQGGRHKHDVHDDGYMDRVRHRDHNRWADEEQEGSRQGRGGGNRGRGGRGGRGRGNQHPDMPPGLKGREIGMWFAQRSKEKKAREDRAARPTISISQEKERHLSSLLHNIQASDNCPPQPSSSYRDPDIKYTDAFDEQACDSTRDAPVIDKTPKSRYFNKVVAKGLNKDTQPSFDYFDNFAGSYDERNRSLNRPSKQDSSDSHLRNEWSARPGADFIPLNTGSKKYLPHTSGHRSNSGGHHSNSSFDGEKQLSSGADFKPFVSDGDTEEVMDEDDGDDNEGDDDEGDLEALMLDMSRDAGDAEEEEIDEKSLPSVTEVYKYEGEDSGFMAELMNHNEANRNSRENLAEAGSGTHRYNLTRDRCLDDRLREELLAKKKEPRYNKMQEFRKKLPSYKMRQEIIDMVTENQVVVISGETGCGKTTQVGQFILDHFIEQGEGSTCSVVCTQPRRISAISVAERVAEERNERCGDGSAGYQIRLEHKLPRTQGSILFCTTGILLKWLAGDPCLSRANYVILDEIHERDLLSDFLMIILRDLLQRRKDLHLVLMSATLNAEMFSAYFGGCPMLNIPGFTFPVKEYLMEDVVEMLKYRHQDPPFYRSKFRAFGKKIKIKREDERQEREDFEVWCRNFLGSGHSKDTKKVLLGMDYSQIDRQLVANLVEYICTKKPEGAILVFLPGWEDINQVVKLLLQSRTINACQTVIIPLHSMMPTMNQKEVFDRPPRGVRKIVVATNIAETSITIDDVVYVIDCGKLKLKNFDAAENISTLQAEWVSRANAKQRRGRAGRVQPGECYHLYTGFHEQAFADYQLPEMLRTRLEELCLQIKLLKLGRIEPFVQKAMQPPSMEALHCSIQLLLDLNALDGNEDLTALGYHLAKMPVDPHTGKMLLFAAMFSCLDPVLTVAASLSFKDAFHIPLGREREADARRKALAEGSKSDHVMLINAFKGWERARGRGTEKQYCWDNFLSQNTLKMLSNMRGQFSELLHEMNFINSRNPKDPTSNRKSGNTKLVRAVICAGLYPNVAKVRSVNKRGVVLSTKTEGRVKLHPKSVNEQEKDFESRWFIYHMKMRTSGIYLYDTTMISPYPILFFGGPLSNRIVQGDECIEVDDWIAFKASKRISKLVTALRFELDKLLMYKITHPGVTDWNENTKEGALMQAITDLIVTEDHQGKITEEDHQENFGSKLMLKMGWRPGSGLGRQEDGITTPLEAVARPGRKGFGADND